MKILFTLFIGIALIGYAIKVFIENKIEIEYRDNAGGGVKANSINIEFTTKKWRKASFTGKWVRPFSVVLSLVGLVFVIKTLFQLIAV